MLTRTYRYLLVAALIAALIYYAWGEITRTQGAQKVSFRLAEEACGNSGSLRYCVYRDRRGTNGDVVYHMHGRNLDERIWNDDTYLTALIQSEWQRRPKLPPSLAAWCIVHGYATLCIEIGLEPPDRRAERARQFVHLIVASTTL